MRNWSLIALVAVLFVNVFAMNVRADEPSKGPSVTFSVSTRSQYVISAGFVLDDKPVIQNDLYVSWGNGTYVDFWTSTSTSSPGTKAADGFGNEVDFSVGHIWHPGACELTAEVAYYQLVPMDDWSDDYFRGKIALARPYTKSGLTPHVEVQQFLGSGQHALADGQLLLAGLGLSKWLNQDFTVAFDSGTAGAENGFVAHYSAAKSFRTEKRVGFSVSLDLYQPISVSDRDFEWVLGTGVSVKLN